MARITVEDCLKTIPNRFELVLAATYRARQLVQGHSHVLSPEIKRLLLHYVKLLLV